jgi:hypothetical protein
LPRDGVAYQLVMVDPASGQLLKTWAAVGAATTAGGYSNGTGWDQSGGYFGQLGLASLAVVHERTGKEAARRAFDWLQAAAPPATRLQDFMANPAISIVPAGFARVPGRLPRCTPASPPRP